MFAISSAVWPGMSKLIGECAKVQQVAGELIEAGGPTGDWDGTRIRDELTDAIAHLRAAMRFVIVFNVLDENEIADAEDELMARFEAQHVAAQVAE